MRQYVERRKQALGLLRRETFVPQSYEWGVEAQCDWYEAWAELRQENRSSCRCSRCVRWPVARPFIAPICEPRNRHFWKHTNWHFIISVASSGGFRYDNLSSAVKKILRGYQREQTTRFIAFRSHWQYQAEFCTPGEGHEKGRRGRRGWLRFRHTNHWSAGATAVRDLAELNRKLMEDCRRDESRVRAGRTDSVGARLLIEQEYLLPLAEEDFDLAVVSFPRVDQAGCAKVRTYF